MSISKDVAIGRHFAPQEVTVAAAVADSEEIVMLQYAGGSVFIPGGSSITTLTYYAAEAPGGTYLLYYDDEGVAIAQTVAASKAYAMPKEVYNVGALKLVGNVAGTVDVFLKG